MSALAKLTDRFTEAEIEDEIVIMRLDNGEFFALSGTAAAIWRLIDGSRDLDGVVDALATQFNAEEDTVTSDVQEFVAQLRETGLLSSG